MPKLCWTAAAIEMCHCLGSVDALGIAARIMAGRLTVRVTVLVFLRAVWLSTSGSTRCRFISCCGATGLCVGVHRP